MTNIDIKNAYVGTTEVKAMYLGSTKVWPVGPDGASTQPGKGDGYTVLPFTLLPFKERII